jgi:hypothetical protein
LAATLVFDMRVLLGTPLVFNSRYYTRYHFKAPSVCLIHALPFLDALVIHRGGKHFRCTHGLHDILNRSSLLLVVKINRALMKRGVLVIISLHLGVKTLSPHMRRWWREVVRFKVFNEA